MDDRSTAPLNTSNLPNPVSQTETDVVLDVPSVLNFHEVDGRDQNQNPSDQVGATGNRAVCAPVIVISSDEDDVILPTTDGKISPKHPGLSDISSIPIPVLLPEKTIESEVAPDPSLVPVPPLVLSFDEGEDSPEKLLATRTLEEILGNFQKAPHSSHGAVILSTTDGKISPKKPGFHSSLPSSVLPAGKTIESNVTPVVISFDEGEESDIESLTSAPVGDKKAALTPNILSVKASGMVPAVMKPLFTVCSQTEPDASQSEIHHSTGEQPTLISDRRNEEIIADTTEPVSHELFVTSVGLSRPKIQEDLMKVLKSHSDQEKETIANLCHIPVELISDPSLQTDEVIDP